MDKGWENFIAVYDTLIEMALDSQSVLTLIEDSARLAFFETLAMDSLNIGFADAREIIELATSESHPLVIHELYLPEERRHLTQSVSKPLSETRFDETFSLFPNPSNGLLNFKKQFASQGDLLIYNSLGQLSANFHLQSGESSGTIEVSNLTNGFYYFVFDGNNSLKEASFYTGKFAVIK